MDAGFARITLSHISGAAEDAVVLGFALTPPAGGFDAADRLGIKTACQNFLNFEHDVASSASNFAVGEWISKEISRVTPPLLQLYEFDSANSAGKNGAALMGSPSYETNLAALVAPDSGNAGLPQEVAVCLSYRANVTGVLEETVDGSDPNATRDRPRARRRGRLFIGPLTASTIEVTGDYARPKPAVRETLILAAVSFQNDLDANAAGTKWSVWSRVDKTLRQVEHAWVDDSFDTQRRRGIAPTTRNEAAIN